MNKKSKHGDWGTTFYQRYAAIKNRCEYEGNEMYEHYGGRGIECEWNSYMDFKDDMFGSFNRHVEKHGIDNTSIERIDNDGNYCKENCKWATYEEQARNNSRNIEIEYNGEKKILKNWAEDLGMNYYTLLYRYKSDWSKEEIFEEDVTHSNGNNNYLTFQGETMRLTDWAEEYGIKPATLHSRLYQYGWPIEKALTEPVN
jgi:hypothetical protein